MNTLLLFQLMNRPTASRCKKAFNLQIFRSDYLKGESREENGTAEDIEEDGLESESDDVVIDMSGVSSDDSDSRLNEDEPSENENESFVALSGKTWSLEMPHPYGLTASYNVIHRRSGLKPGINPRSEKEAFEMFTLEIVQETVI